MKQQGGILEQILREVEIECLPGDIPSVIEADVSELVFGKVLRVSDLTARRQKIKFITDANQPVAHITTVKEEVAQLPEAVAAEAAAAPAEPEVIKKGKQEVEGEEGAEARREAGEAREEREEVGTDHVGTGAARRGRRSSAGFVRDRECRASLGWTSEASSLRG